MVDTTKISEQKFTRPPEQPAELPAEARPPIEAEDTELEPERGEGIEGQPPAETGHKIADLMHLKRKPRPTLPPVRDELTAKIEKILEEGLSEPYSRLSPIAKQEFKLKGEATARTVRDLLRSGHVKVKKILRLIIAWLKMLPGINRFFLEQEAKIKTDKIIALQKRNE